LGSIAVLRIGYVNAAYCYKPSSVVCLSVCLSDCLSVTVVTREPYKTVEPIEMPFWLWTPVGKRNHISDGVQISHRLF